jgi:hypothetical protein
MRHNPKCETVNVVYPDPDVRGSGNTIRGTAGEKAKRELILRVIRSVSACTLMAVTAAKDQQVQTISE